MNIAADRIYTCAISLSGEVQCWGEPMVDSPLGREPTDGRFTQIGISAGGVGKPFAAFWENGKVKNLGSLGGTSSAALGINNEASFEKTLAFCNGLNW